MEVAMTAPRTSKVGTKAKEKKRVAKRAKRVAMVFS
jgi:hypothetical protein